MHSTNYTSTFISVADDCPLGDASPPPERAEPTVARMQYEMIAAHPYRYTSDDVLFAIHARRRGIAPAELDAARAAYFAKGQACLRASPLVKRYGWGIHHDEQSRVAIHARESEEYRRLGADPGVRQVRGVRSGRARVLSRTTCVGTSRPCSRRLVVQSRPGRGEM